MMIRRPEEDDDEFLHRILTELKEELPRLAKRADGYFIDPTMRPKDKRTQWTEKSYIEGAEKRIEAILKDKDTQKWARMLHHVPDMIRDFNIDAYQRFRDIWSLLYSSVRYEPPVDREGIDKDLDPFDPQARCWNCGKFIQDRYRQNTKIRGRKKTDLCMCPSGVKLRNQMHEEIKVYREDLDKKKEREERAKTKREAHLKRRGKK